MSKLRGFKMRKLENVIVLLMLLIKPKMSIPFVSPKHTHQENLS